MHCVCGVAVCFLVVQRDRTAEHWSSGLCVWTVWSVRYVYGLSDQSCGCLDCLISHVCVCMDYQVCRCMDCLISQGCVRTIRYVYGLSVRCVYWLSDMCTDGLVFFSPEPHHNRAAVWPDWAGGISHGLLLVQVERWGGLSQRGAAGSGGIAGWAPAGGRPATVWHLSKPLLEVRPPLCGTCLNHC